MKIPIGVFITMGKVGYTLYSYFFKGPKVDLSMEIFDSSQRFLRASDRNISDKPTFIGNFVGVYDFTNNFKLVFQNTSSNPAYNIKISHGVEYFSQILPLPQNLCLQPHEKFEIDCQFLEKNIHASSHEFGRYFGIPNSIRNKDLVITYQNEARNDFYTIFKINSEVTQNEYLIKNPQQGINFIKSFF